MKRFVRPSAFSSLQPTDFLFYSRLSEGSHSLLGRSPRTKLTRLLETLQVFSQIVRSVSTSGFEMRSSTLADLFSPSDFCSHSRLCLVYSSQPPLSLRTLACLKLLRYCSCLQISFLSITDKVQNFRLNRSDVPLPSSYNQSLRCIGCQEAIIESCAGTIRQLLY